MQGGFFRISFSYKNIPKVKLISVCAFFIMKETLAAFRGFIRCPPDAQENGIIYGMGAWDKGEAYRHHPMNDLMKWERRGSMDGYPGGKAKQL